MSDEELNGQAPSALARVKLAPTRGQASIDLWRALASPFAHVRITCDPADFIYNSEFVNVDGLFFSRSQFDSCETVTHEDSWQAGEDLLLLQLFLKGSAQGQVGDEPVSVGPEQIILQDWAFAYNFDSINVDTLAIQIPRARLPASSLLSKRHPVISWSRESVAGRLLYSTMEEAWQALETMDPSEAHILAEAILGLVNGLVQARFASDTPQPIDVPFVQAMRLFIEEHLSDPDLSAEQLEEVFGCSRASVYRLFEGDGGVMTYIRNRRLSQSHRTLLGRGADGSVSIEAVAERWGFQTSSHFRRAFKKRFGYAPSEIAEHFSENNGDITPLEGVDPVHVEGIRQLHSWSRKG